MIGRGVAHMFTERRLFFSRKWNAARGRGSGARSGTERSLSAARRPRHRGTRDAKAYLVLGGTGLAAFLCGSAPRRGGLAECRQVLQ